MISKKVVALAVSAGFALAAFSGCAAMRRNWDANSLEGTRALERSSDQIRRDNQLAQDRIGAGTARYTEPTNVSLRDHQGIDYRQPLTADHIAGLVGMGEYDVDLAFGNDFRMMDNGTTAGRSYRTTLYGDSSDINVMFDEGNAINEITVTASQAQADRWIRELNSRYGTQQATGEWFANGTRVRMQPSGDHMQITFSNAI